METASSNAPLVLRRSAGDRWSIVAMAAVMVMPVVALAAGAVALAGQSTGAAAFLLVMAAFLASLAMLVVGEARVRWGTRIELDGPTLRLALPARRGYVAHPPVHADLSIASIASVDTRAEAFRSAGTTVIQRAYALALADGTRVVLGADRRRVDAFFASAAEAIAARAGSPIRDLGTVDGTPGMLMLRGQTVPGWDAASLPAPMAEKRHRQESRAWRLVAIVLGLAALVRLLASVIE